MDERDFDPFFCKLLLIWTRSQQGRTDPMGIRAMPWGPPPNGAHQTSKNNANQQKSVTKKAQPSSDNRRNIVMKYSLGGPTDDDEGFFVSADSKCLIRNWESNHFSWWTPQETVDYFKTFYDLILKKSFFTPIMLKVMIYSYQGAQQTTSLQCFFCYLMKVEPFCYRFLLISIVFRSLVGPLW